MKYHLVCCDIDGVLVLEQKEKLLTHTGYWEPHEFEDSIWVTLHRYFGVSKEARAQYKEFHTGIISYKQWVERNVDLWKAKGANQNKIESVFREFTLPTPGARETISQLKAAGIRIAVVSGGLKQLVEFHFPKTFPEIFANDIIYDKEGNIIGSEWTPYDFGGKLSGVHELCKRFSIPMEETVFIGDNINDFQVMEEIGLSIAFNSKSEALCRAADVIIKKRDLREILPFILDEK